MCSLLSGYQRSIDPAELLSRSEHYAKREGANADILGKLAAFLRDPTTCAILGLPEERLEALLVNDAYKPRMHQLYARYMPGVLADFELRVRRTPVPLAVIRDEDPELWQWFLGACRRRLGVPPYPPPVVDALNSRFPSFACSEDMLRRAEQHGVAPVQWQDFPDQLVAFSHAPIEASSHVETSLTQVVQEVTVAAQVRRLEREKGICLSPTELLASSLAKLALGVASLAAEAQAQQAQQDLSSDSPPAEAQHAQQAQQAQPQVQARTAPFAAAAGAAAAAAGAAAAANTAAAAAAGAAAEVAGSARNTGRVAGTGRGLGEEQQLPAQKDSCQLSQPEEQLPGQMGSCQLSQPEEQVPAQPAMMLFAGRRSTGRRYLLLQNWYCMHHLPNYQGTSSVLAVTLLGQLLQEQAQQQPAAAALVPKQVEQAGWQAQQAQQAEQAQQAQQATNAAAAVAASALQPAGLEGAGAAAAAAASGPAAAAAAAAGPAAAAPAAVGSAGGALGSAPVCPADADAGAGAAEASSRVEARGGELRQRWQAQRERQQDWRVQQDGATAEDLEPGWVLATRGLMVGALTWHLLDIVL